jgi:uncharacterized protein involved in exopolysaccharide biosynthesis
LRPDIPFWTWVLTRRIPIFALVATLIVVVGGSVVSRHTQSYVSMAELLFNPTTLQDTNVDQQTQFEFLKFRALTSSDVEKAIAQLGLEGDPMSRANVNFSKTSGKIIVGFQDANPEAALFLTAAITRGFQSTAKSLAQRDAERRAAFHASEVNALRLEVARMSSHPGTNNNEPERRLTEELYQNALDNSAKAKADLGIAKPEILSVISLPVLAKTPSGPNKNSMYLALISFAIFCGLITILILEWLDTIIRRPNDIERTLGFATFGVIPDLQLQPIEATSSSKRGV